MSLVATLAQNFRAESDFDKFENRIGVAGMYDAFKRQTSSPMSFITPDLTTKALASTGRNVLIPVINYKDVTIRSTRPVTIAADENTSALYTVAWTTLAYGFKMYPAQHMNNEISYQRDFNKKFQAMIQKMKSTLEGLAITAVETGKTQVIGEVTGGHTFASNVVSETGIAKLADSYIISDLPSMMASNDYESMGMDVIGNQGFRGIMNRQEGFGEFNSENKTLPFGEKFFHFSNNISNATGKSATGYAISDGALGLLTRVERDAMLGTTSRTGHQWDIVNVPMLDLNMGSYFYEEVVDASGLAGAATADMTRTKAEVFDWAIDVAFLFAYNSDRATIASPAIKFDIATA